MSAHTGLPTFFYIITVCITRIYNDKYEVSFSHKETIKHSESTLLALMQSTA